MRLRTRLITLTVAAGALFAAASFAAPTTAQARTFYASSGAFSPNYAYEPSGAALGFVNVDSVPHRIISYRVYGSRTWSLDITLAPWESYAFPDRFYCAYPSCGMSATYLFREANQSQVIVDSSGYSYCSGYCGKFVVHR